MNWFGSTGAGVAVSVVTQHAMGEAFYALLDAIAGRGR